MNEQTALGGAFKYRHWGRWSSLPILVTDFDIKNLRIFEVRMGDDPTAFDDVSRWSIAKRPMTDEEFAEVNAHASVRHPGSQFDWPNVLGKVMFRHKGEPVRINGYIKRPGVNRNRWVNSCDIDEIKARMAREAEATG